MWYIPASAGGKIMPQKQVFVRRLELTEQGFLSPDTLELSEDKCKTARNPYPKYSTTICYSLHRWGASVDREGGQGGDRQSDGWIRTRTWGFLIVSHIPPSDVDDRHASGSGFGCVECLWVIRAHTVGSLVAWRIGVVFCGLRFTLHIPSEFMYLFCRVPTRCHHCHLVDRGDSEDFQVNSTVYYIFFIWSSIIVLLSLLPKASNSFFPFRFHV